MDGQATGAGGKDDPRLALSIVVPAFNEVTRLGVGIERLQAAVDHGAVDVGVTEFVVVDDGSTDGTAELARDLYGRYPQSTVLRLPANAGKGAAIRRGVASARGAAIAFMDADMAVDPRQIPLLVGALDHADVAIASRALPGSSADHDRLGRTMMGWAFNQIVNAATHVSVGDTQCGFKAFRTPVARLLFHSSTIDRFAFDVEVLYTARRLGLRIAEVPVQWSNAQGTRIRPLRDPLSMLSDVLRSRIGSRPAKLVEAVSVSADAAGGPVLDLVLGSVDQRTPVVPWSGDGALVLLPLFPPDEIARITDRLRDAFGDGAVRHLTLPMQQLVDMAPLAVAPGQAGTGDRRQSPALPICTPVAEP